jgi:hypothetical protein
MAPSGTACDVEAGMSREALDAVGTLLTRDGKRILSVADSLRGADRIVESTVEGGSMGSTLPAGTRIRIELSRRDRYEPGEVIAFFVDTTLIVHRVVASLRHGRFVTRGDATYAPDPPLDVARILGPVSAMSSAGGWVPVPVLARRSVKGRAACWLLAAAIRGATAVDAGAASGLALAIHRMEMRLRRVPARRRTA